ncbi:SWR1 complex subunit 6, partial [Mucuna pruriens]
MDDDGSNSIRRMSSRTRKAALARLDALENDNAGFEIADANNDDDDASLDDEDQVYIQKRHSKGTKRKTRQAKALEARRAPRTFLELLHEANLETLSPHVPSYWKAAVGPPSSTSRRHFCTVCGFSANYTCVRCGMRFCSYRCQNVHNDTHLAAEVLLTVKGQLHFLPEVPFPNPNSDVSLCDNGRTKFLICSSERKSCNRLTCDPDTNCRRQSVAVLPGLSATKRMATHPPGGVPMVFLTGGSTRLNLRGSVIGLKLPTPEPTTKKWNP